MADLREVFPILQDSATGEGEAPISRIEGEAAAAQEGLIGFAFKDSSGNRFFPQNMMLHTRTFIYNERV